MSSISRPKIEKPTPRAWIAFVPNESEPATTRNLSNKRPIDHKQKAGCTYSRNAKLALTRKLVGSCVV